MKQISWMSKYLKGIQHLKQTCTVQTRIDISTCIQNHVTYIYKKYIPFGQAVRLRRIISEDVMLDERLKELETWFTNRGYNSENIKPEIERVKTMNRADLLRKHKKEIDNRITLVLTYHLALTKVYEFYKRHTYIRSNLNV